MMLLMTIKNDNNPKTVLIDMTERANAENLSKTAIRGTKNGRNEDDKNLLLSNGFIDLIFERVRSGRRARRAFRIEIELLTVGN